MDKPGNNVTGVTQEIEVSGINYVRYHGSDYVLP